MSNRTSPAVKEHFIPQVYLRGFSPNQKEIYRFDLKRGKAQDRAVPIKSICFEENLYESIDESGAFIRRNFIETRLGKLEYRLPVFREQLENLIAATPEGKIASFSEPDFFFWLGFIAIQSLRNPITIRSARYAFQRALGIAELSAFDRMLILWNSFPIFRDSTAENCPFFSSILKEMVCMRMIVGYDPQRRFYTSDNPVCCYADNSQSASLLCIIFPITPALVFIFLKNENWGRGIVPFQFIKETQSSEQVQLLNEELIYQARECILSEHAFTENEAETIVRVQNSSSKASLLAQWSAAGIL